MATTIPTTPTVVNLVPAKPLTITTTTTVTYTNFMVVELTFNEVRNYVRVTVAKTDSNNKVTQDIIVLSPAEMQILATSPCVAGDTFMTIWQKCKAEILSSHYGVALTVKS